MIYIREKFLDIDQYGEIISVNRYLGFQTKKSENLKEVSYSVRTTSAHIIVMVRLKRENKSWEAVDMEIKEVHENAD